MGDDYFYVGEYDTENGARWDHVKYCIQTVLQAMDVAQVCLYTLYILLIERNIFIELFTIVDNCCLYIGFKLGLNCNVCEFILA